MNITKRDGHVVPFNPDYIKRAVKKAFEASQTDVTDADLDEIVDGVSIWEGISVESIQDQVVEVLNDLGYISVANEYKWYRSDRAKIREQRDKLTAEVGKRLMATDIQNQNANVDERSFGGRMGEASRAVSKDYALNYCMSEMSRDNHLNNEIYIHDLDSYALGMFNCLTLPIAKLLAKDVETRQTGIRPAKSASTAYQLLAVYFQIQSLNQFGGVAVSCLDWDLVPYVRTSFRKHWLEGYKWIAGSSTTPAFFSLASELSIEDPQYKEFGRVYEYALEKLKKEIEQAVEAMYHNLNSLQSRSGNQLPFSSLNFGTCTLPEGRMIIRALLEGAMKGVGKYHKTPIFPCTIFQIMSGVNKEPGTPNHDLKLLALECTAKRMYPNYVNVDWSGNAGYDRNNPHTYTATMGCRTYNGYDINGLGQLKDGRGNLCPVTIILPTIAMESFEESNKIIESMPNATPEWIRETRLLSFLKLLDKKIAEAKDMLLERFEWICAQPKESASFVYDNDVYAHLPEDRSVKDILRHGTLAIGQLGLAETLQILLNCDQTNLEIGMPAAKRVEELFKTRCKEFKTMYKLNFGVYYSPAENLCYTAMKKFKEKYGEIPNVSDRLYFTNSMHCPVWFECDPFTKIDIESQLTGYSSAGCITYVELTSGVKNNIPALETLIDYAMDKDIPYFAINIPIDDCQNCGASGEFGETCPECGSSNIKRLRRVTGYLSTDYHHFNLGKQQEVEQRVKHK